MLFKKRKKLDGKEDKIDSINESSDNIDNTSEVKVLYVLMERDIKGFDIYAKEHGLPITKCFTSVDDARLSLLLEVRPTRLIIIESGLGKFTNTLTRKEIIDLIGMCDSADKVVSVFYTNSILKTDTISALGKRKSTQLVWYKYVNTYDVIKEILKLKEKYTEGKLEDSIIDAKELLAYVGTEVKLDESKIESITRDSLDLRAALSGGESLQKFKVII